MIWKLSTAALLLVAVTAIVTTQAVSQEPSPEDMQEAMAKWLKLGKPGPMHEFLMKRVGKWTTHSKFYMAPGAPPSEATGTAEMTSALGGRWLRETASGSMMGMPLESFGMSGYDNFRNQFRTVWFDNTNTGFYELTGHLDRSGKILTMHCAMDDAMTGHIGKVTRFVFTMKSDDEFVMEAYDIAAGPDVKVMEITYKRAK